MELKIISNSNLNINSKEVLNSDLFLIENKNTAILFRKNNEIYKWTDKRDIFEAIKEISDKHVSNTMQLKELIDDVKHTFNTCQKMGQNTADNLVQDQLITIDLENIDKELFRELLFTFRATRKYLFILANKEQLTGDLNRFFFDDKIGRINYVGI